MNKENKKKILVVTAMVLAVILVLCKIFYPNAEINNAIGEYQNKVIQEIQAIDEDVIIEDVIIEDITENEEISSDENTIEEATIEDEKQLEDEEIYIEIEGFELENEADISYDGDRAKSWGVELGDYQGLTYFSQLDGRWSRNYVQLHQ